MKCRHCEFVECAKCQSELATHCPKCEAEKEQARALATADSLMAVFGLHRVTEPGSSEEGGL